MTTRRYCGRTVDVRETTSLFRLARVASDLSRSSRLVAIVAADTQVEAREIAAKHDVFGRDWRNPGYAVCETMQTTECHVFGDVVFRSEPVTIEDRRRRSNCP
jgi:hypothetical protein